MKLRRSFFVLRLIKLKRIALLDNDEQLLNEEFQKKLKEYSSDVYKWWKDYYKYSSNDERYLTAVESQIYSDYLDHKLKIYMEKVGIGSEFERLLKGRAEDPEFDAKMNDAFKEGLKNIRIIKGKDL